MKSMILLCSVAVCAVLAMGASATADCKGGQCHARSAAHHEYESRTKTVTKHKRSHSYGSAGVSRKMKRHERRAEYGSHGG